jgi:hypothetical protein
MVHPFRTTTRERERMTFTATMTTGPQRLQALERANAVRLRRAELKRRIADGRVSAADVILDLPWEATSWPVGELLTSQRRWGSIRAHKLLAGLHISETRPVGELTERQRRVVATRLRANASQELSQLAAHPSQTLELVGV